MRTVETKVYTYDELSDAAKEKARDWYAQGVFDHDWWDFTYEDVKNIGLKITAFDLDRNRHARGEFITYAEDCAKSILKEHGPTCTTFQTATDYLDQFNSMNEENDSYDDDLYELNKEFLRSLLEDYSIILQKESEYMQSDEYLAEGIEANEYTFTEDGKRFG